MKILKPPTDKETLEAFDELQCVHQILEECHHHNYFDKIILKYLVDYQLLNSLSLNHILLIAAAFGDYFTIKYTLSLGADINYEFEVDPENIICKNEEGYERYWLHRGLNALGYSIRNNHLDCVKYLAQKGANASNTFLDFVQFVDFAMLRFIVEELKLDVNNYERGFSCFFMIASEYLNQPDNKSTKYKFNYLKSINAIMCIPTTSMEKAKAVADYFQVPVFITHSKTNDYSTYYKTRIVIRPDK